MHVNWKEGKPQISVNDYTDEADVALALRYKSKHIKARCEPEHVEPTEEDREAFRSDFGGILPGVEPL